MILKKNCVRKIRNDNVRHIDKSAHRRQDRSSSVEEVEVLGPAHLNMLRHGDMMDSKKNSQMSEYLSRVSGRINFSYFVCMHALL